MDIVTMVGSLRKDSYNKQLANTMQERYQDKLNMSISDIGSLPFYNQDHENDPPQNVKEFKDSISNSHGVIMITPEYNWSIPGVLKNAIDWASRVDKVFINKPVMVLGTSIGRIGTLRAQIHLRQILSAPGIQARVLPPGNHELLISFAEENFANGTFIDRETLTMLDRNVDAFIHLIKEG